MRSSILSAVPVRMFAARKTFEYIFSVPAQLSHPRFRGIIRPADPPFEVLEMVVQDPMIFLCLSNRRTILRGRVTFYGPGVCRPHGNVAQQRVPLTLIKYRESFSESLLRFRIK